VPVIRMSPRPVCESVAPLAAKSVDGQVRRGVEGLASGDNLVTFEQLFL